MEATKYTVLINVEVLSLDSVRALVMEAVAMIERENRDLLIRKADGDEVAVSIARLPVFF